MINWEKVSDNEQVIKMLKKRVNLEKKIFAIDRMALVRYELEVLNEPEQPLCTTRVSRITADTIEFENGFKLESEHERDCCGTHSLTLDDLTLSDFDGLEFDLTNDNFFKKIPDYGIELIPIKGHSVKIPGHGNNSGYYSTDLQLVITNELGEKKIYDISECQKISDE